MDMDWLSREAKNIHLIFTNMFYGLVLVLLVLGIVLDYFKFSIGGTPQFQTLLGRALIACLLLSATPEIMNMIASFSDELSTQIGGLNNFKLVLARMGERWHDLSWSWISVKEALIMALSFLSFFILYLTVYVMDSIYIYTWMLLYIFSPLLIALFVLPATAEATKGLFKSLILVGSWKILWSVLSCLLWSLALADINKPGANVDFITAIIVNLMLAFSVLYTPKIAASFFSGGLATMASQMGDSFTSGIYPTPTKVASASKDVSLKLASGSTGLAWKGTRAGVALCSSNERASKSYSSQCQNLIAK